MTVFDGSLALSFDFGDTPASDTAVKPPTQTPVARRLSGHDRGGGPYVLPWRRPEKYRTLEHRRRQAQITARRVLAALEHHDQP